MKKSLVLAAACAAAVSARAQPEPPPATITGLIAHPVWVRLTPWTWTSPDRVYPNAASRDHLTGSSSLRCRADDRGELYDCAVTAESRPGVGFGKAALWLSKDYKLRTLDADNIPVRGRLVDLTVEFTPKEWARIVDEDRGPDRSGPPQLARWVVNPLLRDPADYPTEAVAAGVAADVTLRCKVKPDGHLDDCAVGRETPKGLGFGRMALLAKPSLLRVATRALDGSSMAGRTVEVRFVTNPPCWAPADRNQTPCPNAGGRR